MADQESVGTELNGNIPSSHENHDDKPTDTSSVSTTKTQPQLSQVEATTQESCKKIVSLSARPNQDPMPSAGGSAETEEPLEASNPQGVALSRADESAASGIQPPVLEAQVAAQEFLEGRKHNYYRPLYHAANEGDWKTAKSFIDRDPSALTARITQDSLTILMVAARARKWKFMERLVEILPPESLAMQTVSGFSALHFVVMSGSLRTVKALIRKNPTLPQVLDVNGCCPLFASLHSKCKELVWYLILVTKDENPCNPFTGPLSAKLIVSLVAMGFHDIILYLVQRYPELVVVKDENNTSILGYLSLRYSDFLSQSKLTLWERWIYKSVHREIRHIPPESTLVNIKDYLENAEYFSVIAVSIQQMSFLTRVLQWLKRLLWKATEQLAPPLKRIREAKLKHVYANELVNYLCAQISDNMNFGQIIEFLGGQSSILMNATLFGVVETIRAFLHYFPDLVYGDIGGQCNIWQGAIQFRQSKIFNLITTELSTMTQIAACSRDLSGNTILHLAAKIPPPGPSTNQFSSVPGAAFQMQRELQWFEEVEKVVPLIVSSTTNIDGLTPKELFTKEHKELADKAEKWMKDTANSGMIVTTLITTVVLAAAFTVPGGNNDKGIPNFLDRTSFLIFVVSDALALFSSTTSLLMFLSILTARYAEKDFLRALPKRLIIGLGSLFFAIATMMVAFGATLSIVLSEKWQWAYIPIILLGSIPVTIFVMLQLPLFIQMIDSTYGSGIFGS